MAVGMALIGGSILWATQVPVEGDFWSSLAGQLCVVRAGGALPIAPPGAPSMRRWLRWRPVLIDVRCGSYLALALGGGLGGGIVKSGTKRPLWLPYVEVDRIEEETQHARELGARVLLEPREVPAGWRSGASTPQAGEIAFWQRKR
jgi:hypothetical protein